MPWDAWALMFLTVVGSVVSIGCLVEDIRNSGRFETRTRGRHRRQRKTMTVRQEVNAAWTGTNGWKAATLGTGSPR